MSVYWEKQDHDELCGVHGLNSLLQGPFFDEIDLGRIAQELDEQEKQIIQNMKGPSQNVGDSGNYSIQVLEKALNTVKLFTKSISSAMLAQQELSGENGFLCNRHGHWFSLRKVDGVWYYLNSLTKKGPSSVSSFYLSALLSSFQEDGNQIFLVQGEFPYSKKLIDKKGLLDHQLLFLPDNIQSYAQQMKETQQEINLNQKDLMKMEEEESSYWKVLENETGNKYNTRNGGVPKKRFYDPEQLEGKYDDIYDEDYGAKQKKRKINNKYDQQYFLEEEDDAFEQFRNQKKEDDNRYTEEDFTYLIKNDETNKSIRSIELSFWITLEVKLTSKFTLKSKVSELYDFVNSKKRQDTPSNYVLYSNNPETRYFSERTQTLLDSGIIDGSVFHLLKL